MKKLLLFVLPVALLVSCRHEDTKILATSYDTTGYQTVHDSTQIGEILHPGDTLFAHNVPVVQTNYTVQANTAEQWSYAWRHGDIWWMLVGAVIVIAIGVWFIRSNNTGSAGQSSVVALIIGLLIGLGIVGTSLGWWDGYEATITKTQYDYYMKTDGNLNTFFSQQLK